MRVQFLGQEDPLEEEMATHSSILAWKVHGQRSLVAYSPQNQKESDTTGQLSMHEVLLYAYMQEMVLELSPSVYIIL